MIQDPLIKIIHSPRNREEGQEVINLLKILRTLKPEYPPELLKARRASYILQVEQRFRSDSQHV